MSNGLPVIPWWDARYITGEFAPPGHPPSIRGDADGSINLLWLDGHVTGIQRGELFNNMTNFYADNID